MFSYTTKRIERQLRESIAVKTKVIEECLEVIERSGLLLAETLKDGGKILFCGNGGSAADCQHIATELSVRYRASVARRALPALALTVDTSALTAGANDFGFEHIFERSVEAYGVAGDALVGISTSGNSENVLRGMLQARKQGLRTIGLLGNDGGKIRQHADVAVIVPSATTNFIQESHIAIGHIWCEMIEEFLFPELFAGPDTEA